MFIFIDTNIFLSFYHMTSEDLHELEKLASLIEEEEAILYLPEQVIDETKRNRANKINNSFKDFRKIKFSHTYPAYTKQYDEYKSLRKVIHDAENYHKSLVNKLEQDIAQRNLAADLLISRLFQKAHKLSLTDEIYKQASLRAELGNPPGKDNAVRDAVIWETLLRTPFSIDLAFISDDTDYASALDHSKLDDFLLEEWESQDRRIYFFRQISEFFKENYPNINLKAEEKKNELIDQLAESPSFKITHYLISKLSEHEQFTNRQTEKLISACAQNAQIHRILSDDDVFEFFDRFYGSLTGIEEHALEFESKMIEAKDTREEDIDE